MNVASTSNKFFNFTNNINAYLCNIRKAETLTEIEEYNLFKVYRECKERIESNKNNKAYDSREDEQICNDIQNEIIIKNQLMVFACAKEYAKVEDEILDYVSEGNIGLYIAVEKYDPDFISETPDGKRRKPRFLTFAKHYVRRSMREYMDNMLPMIKKSNDTKYKFKIAKIEKDFMMNEHREPTVEEIRSELMERYNLEVKDMRDLYNLDMVSMDMPVSSDEDGESTFADTAEFTEHACYGNDYDEECETDITKSNEYMMLQKEIGKLDEEVQDILYKYFGIGYGETYSIDELAEEYGMYARDMENIVNKAIKYLKQEVCVAC